MRFFHEKGFSLKVPRPRRDRQDEEKREIFRKEMKELCQNPDIDIWFADESGFEGESRPRRCWDKKGSKTHVTHNGDHLRMNVIGMVCPRTGEFFVIEASHVDSDLFQAFLDQANKNIVPQRKHNILIPDNATWHKKRSLNWHNFEPKYLPPYSPDLNPIETVWLIMKQRWFNNHHCRDIKALIDRLDIAIFDLINSPLSVQNLTSFGIDF